MLPRVKINYVNGSLGQVEAMADGCLGFIAIGAAAADKFELGKAYSFRKFSAFEELGVTEENNPVLYKNVKDFYTEAGEGTELWLMGLNTTETFKTALDASTGSAKSLLLNSNGKIRGLIVFKTAAQNAGDVTIHNGMDEDVTGSLAVAQSLGEWATDQLRAPIFTLIEGHAFNGNEADLADLSTMSHNRVGVVIGDTAAGSPNACMGIVAGRLAISPVQRKISRVKDGALTPVAIYVGSELAELADVETVHEKGYITFRTFVGKTGYFIADDDLATAASDDYRALSNRRVIDKAYRIAYNTLVETLNDEVPIGTDGNLSPSWCAALQGDVEQAIISNMTAAGNLGNDPGDAGDTGVACSIPYEQAILATSTLAVSLRVKPSGYAKYINVELGFKTA